MIRTSQTAQNRTLDGPYLPEEFFFSWQGPFYKAIYAYE